MICSYSIVFGLGLSLTFVPMLCLLVQYFRDFRGFGFGLTMSGWGIGTLFFAAANEWLLFYVEWRYIIGIFGTSVAIVILLFCPFYKPRDGKITQTGIEPLSNFLKSGAFIKLALGCFFCGIGVLIPYIHIVPYAEYNDIPQDQALYIILLIGICNAFGRIIFGVLGDRFGMLRVYQFCSILVAIATPFFYFCDQ